MYEKSIAGEHRMYEITVGENPTTIYDLLSTADKTDYNALLKTGVPVQPLTDLPSKNEDMRYRVPIDGFVKPVTGPIKVRLSLNGHSDDVLAGTEYLCPVYFWLNKTWVYYQTPSSCIVRVFFS
jgi:hypothetical protein